MDTHKRFAACVMAMVAALLLTVNAAASDFIPICPPGLVRLPGREVYTSTTPPAELSPQFAPLDIPLDESLQYHAWTLAQYHEVPFEIVIAIMWVESRFEHITAQEANGTVSVGRMQVNSVNHGWLYRDHGLDVNCPYENISAGVLILAMYYNQFDDIERAVAAYNVGPSRARRRYGTSYARRVFERVKELEGLTCVK